MIHRWHLRGVVDKGSSRFFEYKCKSCGVTTLNGEPLKAPFNKTCGA